MSTKDVNLHDNQIVFRVSIDFTNRIQVEVGLMEQMLLSSVFLTF